MLPSPPNEAVSLMAPLMSRADSLRRYVEAKIPSRLRRTVSSDDILQDIWITAVRSVADVRPHGPDDLDRWLTRVAQRRIADAIRRAGAAKRGGRDAIMYDRRQTSSFVDLFSHVSGREGTPSREVSTKEAVHAVQIALAALPEDYRIAIELRYLEGNSQEEIAKLMHKTRPSVNSLLFRGMRKLRELLEPVGRFLSDDGCATRLSRMT